MDNNGDAKEDITFQFRFTNKLNSVALPIGTANVAIPLIQAGAVSKLTDPNLNLNETFAVAMVRGDRRKGTARAVSAHSDALNIKAQVGAMPSEPLKAVPCIIRGGGKLVLRRQPVIHRHHSAVGEMGQLAAQGVMRGNAADRKTAAMKVHQKR